MGKRGRLLFQEQFSNQAISEQLLAMYRSVLQHQTVEMQV
jgi:hypothetical protein